MINFSVKLKNGDLCTIQLNQPYENRLKARRIGQIIEDTFAELAEIPVDSIVDLKNANYKVIKKRLKNNYRFLYFLIYAFATYGLCDSIDFIFKWLKLVN